MKLYKIIYNSIASIGLIASCAFLNSCAQSNTNDLTDGKPAYDVTKNDPALYNPTCLIMTHANDELFSDLTGRYIVGALARRPKYEIALYDMQEHKITNFVSHDTYNQTNNCYNWQSVSISRDGKSIYAIKLFYGDTPKPNELYQIDSKTGKTTLIYRSYGLHNVAPMADNKNIVFNANMGQEMLKNNPNFMNIYKDLLGTDIYTPAPINVLIKLNVNTGEKTYIGPFSVGALMDISVTSKSIFVYAIGGVSGKFNNYDNNLKCIHKDANNCNYDAPLISDIYPELATNPYSPLDRVYAISTDTINNPHVRFLKAKDFGATKAILKAANINFAPYRTKPLEEIPADKEGYLNDESFYERGVTDDLSDDENTIQLYFGHGGNSYYNCWGKVSVTQDGKKQLKCFDQLGSTNRIMNIGEMKGQVFSHDGNTLTVSFDPVDWRYRQTEYNRGHALPRGNFTFCQIKYGQTYDDCKFWNEKDFQTKSIDISYEK